MKITEWFFPVVLSSMLYNMGQTFESVDEIFKCVYSNDSH